MILLHLLTALALQATPPTSGAPELESLANSPIGGLYARHGGSWLRDFRGQINIFNLESRSVSKGAGATAEALDFTRRELLTLSVVTGKAGRLDRAKVSDSWALSGWLSTPLPPRSVDHRMNGSDRWTASADAETVLFNAKRIAIIYNGPRIRLFDRASMRPLGEKILYPPMYDWEPNSRETTSAQLSSSDGDICLTTHEQDMEAAMGTTIHVGRIGGHFRSDPVSPGSVEHFTDYAGAAGTLPLANHGWAIFFENGWVRSYSRDANGRYRHRVADHKVLPRMNGWRYDSQRKVGYSVVNGYLSEVSTAHWPKVDTRRAIGGPELRGRCQIGTFAGGNWVSTDDGLHVLWYEKGAHEGLTYRFTTTLKPGESFVPIRS